jgi:hypothetical protein
MSDLIKIPPTIDDATFRRLVLTALRDGVAVGGINFTGDITFGKVEIDQDTPNANRVVVGSSALPSGAATQTTLASILAKIIAAPSTEAKQDTANALLNILVAALASPATAANQTTGNSTLSTINGKITACNTGAVTVASSALPTGAATQATLAALDAKVTAVNTGAVVIASGAVTSTPATLTRANTSAYATNLVVKNSAGRLFSLAGYNSGPAQFIHIYDAASLPSEATAPAFVLAVPAQASFFFDFGGNALPCSVGIVVGNSSTGPTKTIGSANCFFTALYL